MAQTSDGKRMVKTAMKLVVCCAEPDAADHFAERESASGVIFCSTSKTTGHLPFASLFVGATDNLDAALATGDVGVYLACERSIRNKLLSQLAQDELPGAVGLFPMVAKAGMSPQQSDRYWRDTHAPLALEVHTTMTHYYQFAIVHRFQGPEWCGIAACCCATEDDLRHNFYSSKAGEQQIFEDIRQFAHTRHSPRRVIARASLAG